MDKVYLSRVIPKARKEAEKVKLTINEEDEHTKRAVDKFIQLIDELETKLNQL